MVFSSVLFLFRFLPIFYDLLFPGSPEHEESGSVSGEPGLLCLGRAGLYFSDAFFHDFRILYGEG